MVSSLWPFFISSILFVVLVSLFHVERVQGKRVFSHARGHLDFWVLKLEHAILRLWRGAGKDIVRQILHYFFHTILMGIIRSIRTLEMNLKTLVRSNKKMAKKSERERVERNKLEEVALHKMEVALTEEEKRRHRERVLNGR